MKNLIRFKSDITISSPLAIVFLMVLSFLVAWLTIIESEKILSDAKNSPAINFQKRPGGEILNNQVR